MRWLSFLILTYLIIGVQIALSGYVNYGRVAPNLVLPAAVFIAIGASREAALLGALLLGLAQDLFSQAPLGLFAFSYALMAIFIASASSSVNRDHPLTHFALTLLGAILVNSIACLNEWLYPLLHGSRGGSPSLTLALGSALYTAIVGVVMLGILCRAKRLFAFRSHRTGIAARHLSTPR